MPTPNIPPPDAEGDVSAYWITDELHDAYCLALGKFVDAYGGTEGHLSHCVTRFIARNLGNGSHEAAKFSQALVGGQRAGELIKLIKRVMRVSGSSDAAIATAERGLTQLGYIHEIRDRLVHQGASPEFYEGRWAVRNSNHNQIREEDQGEEIWFLIDDLDHMTEDLFEIRVIVRFALFPELMEMTKLTFDAFLVRAWLYKPSSLIRVRRKKPNKSAKSKRPHRSSRT